MKVNIIDHSSLSIMLISAMAARCKDHERLIETFKLTPAVHPTIVELTFLVNGVEVDLTAEVARQIDAMFETIEQRIHDKAVELIKDKAVSLQNLIGAIDRAEWEISEALKGVGITS